MSYRVVLTRSAARDLQTLHPRVAPAIVETLYGPLTDNPHRMGHPLRLQLEGAWSARRADYRIVYLIDEAERIVTVLRIAHRRDAYR